MTSADDGSDLGIEASLFKAAGELRGNIEPSDYKRVVLRCSFPQIAFDSFKSKRPNPLAEYLQGARDPGDKHLLVKGMCRHRKVNRTPSGRSIKSNCRAAILLDAHHGDFPSSVGKGVRIA